MNWAWSPAYPRVQQFPVVSDGGALGSGTGAVAMTYGPVDVTVVGPLAVAGHPTVFQGITWSLDVPTGNPAPGSTVAGVQYWPQLVGLPIPPNPDVPQRNIPHAVTTHSFAASPQSQRKIVAMESPGVDGRPDIVTLYYGLGLNDLKWSNRYSHVWDNGPNPRLGADVPVAVLVPSVNSKDQGFGYLGATGGATPISVVGDSTDKFTGHDVVFLLYENTDAGSPPAKPRRWSSAGMADDVPVGATYALATYFNENAQQVLLPIVIAAGHTTLANGSRDTFIVAQLAWQPGYSNLPQAGTLAAGYPMVFHTDGRSNTPVGIKATRDGIYVAGTSQSLTDAHDAKMFLAKFDYAQVPVLPGQTPGPRWVEYSTPLNEPGEERAVAMDFVVEPNPGLGTWLYVTGNRTGEDPVSSFVTMQAFDGLGTTSSDPSKRWKAIFNRPSFPVDHGTGNDVVTCISAAREPSTIVSTDPGAPDPLAPMVTVTGTSINDAGARSVMLTVKYTNRVPTVGQPPKSHRWYMVTSALNPSNPAALAYYYPKATEVRTYGSENRVFVAGGLWQPCGQGVSPCAEQLFVTSYIEMNH